MRSTASRYDPHPAPGDLRRIQLFLNTLDIETGKDTLDSPGALATWLSTQGLLPAGASLDDATLRQAISAREALRTLVTRRRNLTGEDLAHLNEICDRVDTRLRFTSDGSLEVTTADDGFPGALARLLHTVFDAMQADRWQRLKACHDETCRQIFFDASNNRAGKWCALRCGNKINARKYRKRGPAWKTGRFSWKI